MFILPSHRHVCWSPGQARSLDISYRDIVLRIPEYWRQNVSIIISCEDEISILCNLYCFFHRMNDRKTACMLVISKVLIKILPSIPSSVCGILKCLSCRIQVLSNKLLSVHKSKLMELPNILPHSYIYRICYAFHVVYISICKYRLLGSSPVVCCLATNGIFAPG